MFAYSSNSLKHPNYALTSVQELVSTIISDNLSLRMLTGMYRQNRCYSCMSPMYEEFFKNGLDRIHPQKTRPRWTVRIAVVVAEREWWFEGFRKCAEMQRAGTQVMRRVRAGPNPWKQLCKPS
ncbi:hypothetical protein ANCDUO_05125 [Ancylostoma duodenale]|uniref:Uncharacterized protein n=1 Tax=Ancylostoma duodenale TaxID=51022 RepID=A0A0C2D4U4_9BILA|nr:hypothetical protein ANCDUO_05125 [Ancylostoma duodenale]